MRTGMLAPSSSGRMSECSLASVGTQFAETALTGMPPARGSLAYTTVSTFTGSVHTGGTFASSEAGFSTTKNDVLTVRSVDDDVATAQLTAKQSDGTINDYPGTYTVVGGVIVAFDIQQTD